jgi:hypothetical protein
MNKKFWYLAALLVAASMWTVGCGNSDESTDTEEPKESDPVDSDKGDGGPSDIECTTANIMETNRSNCDESKICAALPDGQDADCIANFNLGTAQAGFRNDPEGYDHVGWYGYNDHTGGTMEPPINNNASEPATCVETCDPNNNFALHVFGEGWTGWGAGIGLDWGTTPNPYCDDTLHPGGLKCLEVFEEDPNFLITTAEADPRCQNDDGTVSVDKMKCVLYSKNYKEYRDLSDYKGIAFWAMPGPDFSDVIQIGFGVPETTRFIADASLPEEYRLTEEEGRTKSMTYEGGCSDDDASDTNKCYGDYATTLNMGGEPGVWGYYEVLFSELMPLTWGMKLPSDTFTSSKSIGIKFQTDKNITFDYYITDIHFIR